MRNNEVYQAQVFSVLKNKDLRSSLYEEDLLAIGVIKRTTSYTLIIRNKIYEAILRDTLYSDQNNGVVMKKYKVFIGSSSEGRKNYRMLPLRPVSFFVVSPKSPILRVQTCLVSVDPR